MRPSKILIVDDSELDRMVLQRAFSKTDTVKPIVHEAESAEAAIDAFKETDFDAVILDINMPGHSGFHALKHMRAGAGKTWPLIFMYSSSTHPDDIDEAYKSQATAFLPKPLVLREIQEVVDNCLSMVNRTVALL
ncbi:MAG: response regulator [Litorimonas sp.]